VTVHNHPERLKVAPGVKHLKIELPGVCVCVCVRACVRARSASQFVWVEQHRVNAGRATRQLSFPMAGRRRRLSLAQTLTPPTSARTSTRALSS
jgi:hypothetical protein